MANLRRRIPLCHEKEENILSIDLKIDLGIHTGEFLRIYKKKGNIFMLTKFIFPVSDKGRFFQVCNSFF